MYDYVTNEGIESEIKSRLISAREKLTVCDVTNLPYMDIN